MRQRSFRRDERSKRAKYTTWQMVGYILSAAWKQDKLLFFIIGIQTAVIACTPFIGVIFPRYIIDELTSPTRNISVLIWLVGAMFVLLAVSGIITQLTATLREPRIFRVRAGFMQRHAEKCMTTEFRNTENSSFLDRAQLAWQGLWRVEATLYTAFDLLGQCIAFIGYIAIVTSLSPWILLCLLVNVGVVYFLTHLVDHYEYKMQDEIAATERRGQYLYNVIYDFAYGKDVRVFRLSRWLMRRFIESRAQRLEQERKIQKNRFLVGLGHFPNDLVRDGIVYAYLIWQAVSGAITIGEFTMYVSAIASFGGWMIQVINNFLFIIRQSWYVSELREFLETEEPQTEDVLPLPEAPYTVEFRHVSFRYPAAEQDVYSDLSLVIPAGQRLALVGSNGAGKTTFIKLLCRLYEPTGGEILLNGINIRRFKKEDYMGLFAPVFQEVRVTAFSAAENVAACEKEAIDRERVEQCLLYAGVLDKIQSLPKGLDTPMLRMMEDDGVELSGGEKQKLALARALYKNSPILLLDEPTAALDALAEAHIYQTFDKLVEDRTAVYISHRLASTHFCDRIALLEDGVLLEYGTHEELLKKGGSYARMFQTQAQYYREQRGKEAATDEG